MDNSYTAVILKIPRTDYAQLHVDEFVEHKFVADSILYTFQINRNATDKMNASTS